MEISIKIINNSNNDFVTIDGLKNFIIQFYWLEKNRVFEITKKKFKETQNDRYELVYTLPSIVEGKYRFFASDEVSRYVLKIKLENKLLYDSCIAEKNHTFEIIKDSGLNETFNIQPISYSYFIKLENETKYRINMSSIKRWNYYWYNIHYFTHNYYPQSPSISDMNQMRNLINVMKTSGIPCLKCKAHFNSYIKKNPIEDAIRDGLLLHRYFIDLQNEVNKQNNKIIFSYEDAQLVYDKSPVFEKELESICEPLYSLFKKSKAHLFPTHINSPETRERIIKKFEL
jgi:hypothetical protein